MINEIFDFESHMYEEVKYFGNVFYALLYVTVNETRNIAMSEVSITLNYNQFEIVSSQLLDFEGHKYKEVDCFSW